MNIGKINTRSLSDNAYLSPLVTIAVPPEHLYVIGSLPSKRRPSVAIVGTRKPSAYGKEVTYNLAYALAGKGVVIISGLAYGVDSIAHQAALDAGGTTIAVLANGLHKIYPAQHSQLAKDIVKGGGALVTEYPIGQEAMRHHFLARNRIVSGLADAVIVIEAADQSG
ncbi:DNA-processing protein DprA, partial [Candidatus Saccharibacteria bacterium]|nr:DNA-processing protein DprA [Candidatus Saccharibacteria bacterium]